MRTSTIFGAKNSGFFEIYGMSAETEGLNQSEHFVDKGSIFRYFVRASFMNVSFAKWFLKKGLRCCTWDPRISAQITLIPVLYV